MVLPSLSFTFTSTVGLTASRSHTSWAMYWKWQVKTPEPMIGGILATAGGLVFTGEGNGKFAAYNSSTGKELWNFRAGAGVNAPPSSYMVGGKQYVVVGAGGNTQVDFHRGNNIIAFSLNSAQRRSSNRVAGPVAV